MSIIKKLTSFDFIESSAIKLLFTSLGCKFLSGAFLYDEFKETGIYISNLGLLLTLLLLILAVVIEVIKTPPPKKDKDGVLIIYEEEENDDE